MQGWKPRRIYADFVVALRDDEAEADDGFHQVFVVETKGVHLQRAEDTEYKRSVFDICCEQPAGPIGRSSRPRCGAKVMRFEVVYEDEWHARLNGMLSRGERMKRLATEHLGMALVCEPRRTPAVPDLGPVLHTARPAASSWAQGTRPAQ